MVDGAMFFGRFGDTDCAKQNNQAAGSQKCHLPKVRNLDTHPFDNPQLILINNISEQFAKQNFGHRTERKDGWKTLMSIFIKFIFRLNKPRILVGWNT